MSDVAAIFDSMPVEGDTSSQASDKQESSIKEMGDRVSKGNTNSRIEAFGEMLGDDDYGGTPGKHEPVKVEKEKTSVASAKSRDDGEVEKEESSEVIKEEKPIERAPQQVEIPKDAKVKVKIDGVDQEVSIEDLKSGYSGKQAISKRFTELDNEKKSFAKEKTQVLADGNRMREEIASLKGGFESAINEYNKNGFTVKNPLTLVDQLLDKIGVDSHAYNRSVFEHNLPEYAKFFEMDEVQRDAYFAKKENEFLRKKDQTFMERTQQAQAQTARQQQEYNMIKGAGLSIDGFNQHFEELAELGNEDLSVEKVLEFAKIKPIWDKAGDIVSRSIKSGDVALIQDVSRLLMEFPNTTEEEILEHINGKSAARNASKKVAGKENYTVDTSSIARKSTQDDFSDEDMEMFKAIRRK
jgi:hypothetical protein